LHHDARIFEFADRIMHMGRKITTVEKRRARQPHHFAMSVAGVVVADRGYFHDWGKAQPPVFNPASNPYAKGIFANGIVESYQANGQNINIYPEVSGTIRQIFVGEGDTVRAGAPLLAIDDTVQQANVAQQKAQREAAATTLQELKAQPRKETLAVAQAQLVQAGASLRTAQDQFDKQQRSYDIEPRSVSMDALDTARNTVSTARAAFDLAQKQYDLTRAGAWIYAIRNQERQVEALAKTYQGARAVLEKYTLKAPVDGVVLSLNSALGSYVSPQGIYNTYTQGAAPALVMATSENYYNVRCYIDEILISRLPPPDKIAAQMSIRGTDVRIALQFLRVQPYVSPKISLSDQRQERVDVRVLPVIFRFAKRDGLRIYPGQLVDVYVGKNVRCIAPAGAARRCCCGVARFGPDFVVLRRRQWTATRQATAADAGGGWPLQQLRRGATVDGQWWRLFTCRTRRRRAAGTGQQPERAIGAGQPEAKPGDAQGGIRGISAARRCRLFRDAPTECALKARHRDGQRRVHSLHAGRDRQLPARRVRRPAPHRRGTGRRALYQRYTAYAFSALSGTSPPDRARPAGADRGDQSAIALQEQQLAIAGSASPASRRIPCAFIRQKPPAGLIPALEQRTGRASLATLVAARRQWRAPISISPALFAARCRLAAL
jgi:HlyD family secretion protein